MTTPKQRAHLDQLLAERNDLEEKYLKARRLLREKKQEIDQYRKDTGQISEWAEPSVETDEDRAVAQKWDQDLKSLAALDPLDRAKLIVMAAEAEMINNG